MVHSTSSSIRGSISPNWRSLIARCNAREKRQRLCSVIWLVPELVRRKQQTGPAASSMTSGRRLRLVQLLVAEVVGWFQKTIGVFALHKCRGIADITASAAVLAAVRWRFLCPAPPARRRQWRRPARQEWRRQA